MRTNQFANAAYVDALLTEIPIGEPQVAKRSKNQESQHIPVHRQGVRWGFWRKVDDTEVAGSLWHSV